MSYLLLALGGALGALCRYHGGRIIHRRIATTFPLGTFAINLSGSFLLGLLAGLLALHPDWPGGSLNLVFGIGFCGAYTTFSSFAFETLQLWRQHQRRHAIANLLGQPLLGICAAWLGLLIGSRW
ncbi:MAG TPA: fluoride efflux transporter CrcB [Herpetosiphonaceae bacterium]